MKKLKEAAYLKSYDSSGTLLDELIKNLHDYYDESVEMIDSAEFRRKNKVIRISGQLFDGSGSLIQEFENLYGSDGTFLRGTVKHARLNQT